jgi:hypothetical protein
LKDALNLKLMQCGWKDHTVQLCRGVLGECVLSLLTFCWCRSDVAKRRSSVTPAAITVDELFGLIDEETACKKIAVGNLYDIFMPFRHRAAIPSTLLEDTLVQIERVLTTPSSVANATPAVIQSVPVVAPALPKMSRQIVVSVA